MDDNQMLDTLRGIICEFVELKPEQITPETNVRSDLALNSLELINMAVAIEDAFDTEIPDREVSRIETLQDVMDIIKEYME